MILDVTAIRHYTEISSYQVIDKGLDLEKIIFSIKNAGFKIVTNPIDAHIIIINTCSFIISLKEITQVAVIN